MKILIFGAGVIGTAYAWQLQEAGHDVTLFVRKLRMVRYGHSGVSITYSDNRQGKHIMGKTVFRPKVIDKLDPKNAFNLIIVSVKSNQWQDVIPYISKYSADADVLLLGNIWDELNYAEKHFPKGRFCLGFPGLIAGGQIENGINSFFFKKGHTIIGEVNGEVTERVKQIAAIFETSGLQPGIKKNITDWMAHYYLLSAITPGLISKAGNARLFVANNTLIKQYLMALKEGQKIIRRKGVKPVPLFPFNKFFLPSFILVSLTKRQFDDETAASMDAHMKHGASEKKKQYYDVLYTAKRLKVPVPYWASFEKYMDFS
ncbi:MAG: hypothetical protein EA394_04580 [Bacteroidia bacterium]|nr:MAG: hypothetical protein EA394_04580 [Bacteroidia bacterium]